MHLSDKLALILAILAILLSAWVSYGVAEGLAQLEDEYAYQWQAQITAHGDLKIASPPEAVEFVVPFIIDHDGERFGKYPLGWPVVLSFGERFGLARLVNPLLAGLAVWLTYRLGQKLLGDQVGLLAAGLTVISPLFLTLSGSILSHVWAFVLSISLAISWLDITDKDAGIQRAGIPGWLPTLTAGLSLGVLALSRPWTAIGVAIPFSVHGSILLWRGPNLIRKRILAVGVIALLISSIHILWQFALTGDPLMNPYLLWWPYDKIGFGPGFGVTDQGHTLSLSLFNTGISLGTMWQDLWGWGQYSWVLLLIGLWAVRHQLRVWLIASVFPSLVVVYLAYWVSGPRYFFEGLYSLTILGAAGIIWLGGWMRRQQRGSTRPWQIRQAVVLAVFAGLVLFGTIVYTPTRLHEIKKQYGFSQSSLAHFRTPKAQEMTPALVILHTTLWKDYGVYLNLQDPYLTSPFIFAWASPEDDPSEKLAAHYTGRQISHYYPKRPGRFYDQHLPWVGIQE